MRIVRVKYLRTEEFQAIPGFVYCGRAWGGFPQSPLANPFRPAPGTNALARFAVHLKEALAAQRPDIVEAMQALREDSVLGCWCIDKDEAGVEPIVCHCDMIAQVWKSLQEKNFPYP